VYFIYHVSGYNDTMYLVIMIPCIWL